MANPVTLTSTTYREASYLDCSIVYNDIATISGVGLTTSGTLTISDPNSELSNNSEVYVNNVEGTIELNNRTFTLVGGTAVSGSEEVITMVSGVPTATGTNYYSTDMTTYHLQQSGVYADLAAYSAWVPGTGTVERWATTISGLEHLEGLEVVTLAEGAVLSPETVSNGRITLQYPIKYGIIGLAYDAYITTMPLEVGNDLGAAIGAKKKVSDCYVRLYKSLGVRMGPDPDNVKLIPFRTSSDYMDQATPLYTGDKRYMMNKGFSGYQTVCVKSEDPLPLTVLAIVPAQYTAMR